MLSTPRRIISRARRASSGLTLVETGILIALVGVAILTLAESLFIEAQESEVDLSGTLNDIREVTDALQGWADVNYIQPHPPMNGGRWPYHLYSLVTGCTLGAREDVNAFTHIGDRLGSCKFNVDDAHRTGGWLAQLPSSRFPPPSCSAEAGGVNCEFHFDKTLWDIRTAPGEMTPPMVPEGVTVQFYIKRHDEDAVVQLAEAIKSMVPDVTVATVPGEGNQRIIKFRVLLAQLECQQTQLALSDPLAHLCNERRRIAFDAEDADSDGHTGGDLRNVRRISLRGEQPAATTDLSGPGLTLPESAGLGKGAYYWTHIGSKLGVPENPLLSQYLELVWDRMVGDHLECPTGGTDFFLVQACTQYTSTGDLTYTLLERGDYLDDNEILRLSSGLFYPGLSIANELAPMDVDLLSHYGLITEADREVLEYDKDPVIRLRIGNPYTPPGGSVTDTFHDFLFTTGASDANYPGVPGLLLCADHRTAGADDTAAVQPLFPGNHGVLHRPCRTGVVLEMAFNEDRAGNVTNDVYWDIRLTNAQNSASVQTRLCRLEAAVAGLDPDCTCPGSTQRCTF